MLGDARSGKFAENLVGFGRALRRAGVQIDSSKIALATRAAQIVGLGNKHHLSAALQSVLISEQQDLAIFSDLFAAYFTEGKNIDDFCILVDIGVAAGLDKAEIETALTQNTFAKEIQSDLDEARALKISGVPFFVFNKKYAVSGAQPADSLLQMLQKSFSEMEGK